MPPVTQAKTDDTPVQAVEEVAVTAPPLNMNSILNQPVELIQALLTHRDYYWIVAGLLLVFEALLGFVIIKNVSYTKIDWPAYMQQADMFLAGERDYSKIEGETGPLVYPAFHLYIYTALFRHLPADGRERPAQYLWLGLELATFGIMAAMYYLSGHRKHIPQWLLIPLVLSKRSHSIYLLRLFNDPIAMLLFYAGVTNYVSGLWDMGSVYISVALATKMNILLFFPGLLVILFQYRGVLGMLKQLAIIAGIQVLLPALKFFDSKEHIIAYYTSAFDFSREFLYKWTVNWAMVSEKTFLSASFSKWLLIGHAVTLVIFGLFVWSPVRGGTAGVLKRGFASIDRAPVSIEELDPSHIPLVLFTSNLIGMTFARSLHYQFHAWYFHQLPLVLYLGGAWGQTALIIAIQLILERAWDTFPATARSSTLMLVMHITMICGLLFRGVTRLPVPAPRKDQ